MHTLLPPNHQRTNDSVLRILPNGRSSIGRSQEPQRPDSRISKEPQRAGFEATSGHWREDVLQLARRFGSLRRPADGWIHVSERSGAPMERADRSVSVSHRTCSGCIHPGFARESIPRGSSKTNVSSGAPHCPGISDRCTLAVAIAPRTPRALVGNVSHSQSSLGDGHVWVCVLVVPDGCVAFGDLARLPA